MNSLEVKDVFEPYYEGRDGLLANAARDETVHAAPRAKRPTVQAPPIAPAPPAKARR
jgi:hypothetical protein